VSHIMELRKAVGHRPLIMPCACVILEDGAGKVLLQKRADDGKWSYHGGAVELNEAVEDAARREVKEELGIELGELRLFGVYSGADFRHIYPNGDEVSNIDIVYVCRAYSGTLKPQAGEVEALRFFAPEDIPENLSPPIRKPLEAYLAARSNG